MSLPLISVIIPAHNAAKFLPDSIGSLRAQRNILLDIIVVDDGSTDDTPAVAESLGSDVRVLQTSKLGPGAARNRGIEPARGDYIALLDADDLFPPNSLTARAERLAADPSLSIVSGFIQMITLIGAESTAAHDPARIRNVPYLNVNLGASLYRRDVFERVGGFNEALMYAEDVDWHLRAQEADAKLLTLRCVTLHYRRHPTNVTLQAPSGQIHFTMMNVLSQATERRGTPTTVDALNQRFAESVEPPPDLPAPTISIIIGLNDTPPDQVDATIKSVLEQSSLTQSDAPALDLIVVGGDSAVGAALAERIRGRFIAAETDNPAAHRNAGIAAAQGDLIAFIEAGDSWLRDKLARQVAYLRVNPHIDYIVGYAETSTPTSAPPMWATPLSSLLTRRSVFEQIGGFDPAYPLAYAADWFIRALDANIARAHPNEICVRMTRAAENQNGMQREIARIHLASLKRRQHEMKYRQS